MTNLKALKSSFIKSLHSIYEDEELLTFFNWLAEDLLDLKTHDLLLKSEVDLSAIQLKQFELATKRLQKEEPIQYILGYAEFFGLKLNVNSNVLIPRPETEELVQWILDDQLSQNLPLSVLDLGTGSGCIPIALAKHWPQAKIKALDVSSEALSLASVNLSACLRQAESEENDTAVEFINADLLKLETLPEVDIVVSNPPYVKYDEQLHMRANVLEHEPHFALFVKDDDPLVFYRKIAELTSVMKHRPLIYLEINQYLAHETCELFRDFGFKYIELRKDFRGNDRMIKIY